VGGNAELHARVVQPTELRALAAVDSGLFGLESQNGGAARNGVELAAQAGHPKGVDHIRSGEVNIHRSADGNMQLIAQADIALGVMDLPPPLMPGNVNAQDVFRSGQGQHAVPGGNAEGEQHGDSDEGQQHPAADDPGVVAALIVRFGVAAYGVEPQGHHHREHQAEGAEHQPPQLRHRLGGGAGGVEDGVGAAATTEQRQSANAGGF
jgi:hypothetical protein